MNRLLKRTIALFAVLVLAMSSLCACSSQDAAKIAGAALDVAEVLLEESSDNQSQPAVNNQQGSKEEKEELPAEDPKIEEESPKAEYTPYYFRNNKLLSQHYEKHGIDMGFDSKESYEAAASDVINNPDALSKEEAEDGDFCYYIEATNEFVVLSKDGYIRTYFCPDAGKKYYDKQ